MLTICSACLVEVWASASPSRVWSGRVARAIDKADSPALSYPDSITGLRLNAADADLILDSIVRQIFFVLF